MTEIISRVNLFAGRAIDGLLNGKAGYFIREARAAQHQRDWASAEALWRQVTEVAPRNAGAWVQLGNMLNELERRSEAIAAFKQARAINPNLAQAPAGIAGVHERAGLWSEAIEAWADAIELLSRNTLGNKKNDAALAHALSHASMAVRNGGSSAPANDLIQKTMEKFSDSERHSNGLVIRAQLLPPGNSPTVVSFLQDFTTLLSSVAGHPIEAGPAVRSGNLFDALVELSSKLQLGKNDRYFLRVASKLYDNARMWSEVMVLAEWQANLEPSHADHLVQAFQAAAKGRRLSDARRLARRHARTNGDLILIHNLAELYESVKQPEHARLLIRFLRRRWPHSRWHTCRYIVLTAQTRSLALADRLVRAEIAEGRLDHELKQAYFKAPFVAGQFDEARLRAISYLKENHDVDTEVLLGYLIANSVGIENASEHFRELAVRTMQGLGPMVGTAHMAMRKRDMPQAMRRWLDISIVHPGASNADVERARCAYDMGEIQEAIRICQTHRKNFPNDVAMSEFYAWLLTMNGQYDEALPEINTILQNYGPNWQAVDLYIICTAQLGRLDDNWDRVLGMMPASDAGDGVSRFYHVLRILIAVERRDLARKMLVVKGEAIKHLPWVAPYLRDTEVSLKASACSGPEQHWEIAARKIRSDLSDRLDAMSDTEVEALLGRSARAFPLVHIVNKFEQPRGGSELHALDLAEAIGRYSTVKLWAPEMPHPDLSERKGVSHIDPTAGVCPRGGVLVFIGVYFEIAQWVHHVRPDRVIFLYNTFESPSLFERIAEVFRETGVRPELLYCAEIMGQETGLPGRFEPSPTDLELFSPTDIPRPLSRPFTLGRHSRDVPEKHGRDDWKIYQQVSAMGGESVILGGACMSRAFPDIRGLHLLKARSSGIPEFLHGLDAYVYRTSTWIEPWGRVVIEAMACGLPVLVHSAGGYAQAIKHETNGLLFDTTDDAIRQIQRLIKEPDLRHRLGAEARNSVCNLLSDFELKRMIAFYLLDHRNGLA